MRRFVFEILRALGVVVSSFNDFCLTDFCLTDMPWPTETGNAIWDLNNTLIAKPSQDD